jgi:hypothetical protein
MGEPKTSDRLAQREPWLVLFGGGAMDQCSSVNETRRSLDRICSALGCDRIIAIGDSRQETNGRAGLRLTKLAFCQLQR